jgi:hypothetical protein
MKITQEVRDFARLQEEKALSLDGTEARRNAGGIASTGGSREGDVSASPAPVDADEGMAEMSKRFHDEGGELYVEVTGSSV